MTRCQNCHRPTQLFLCENCTTQLANMLDEIPWLLDELDARIQNLARVTHGTIGRHRRPDELNVMDFDAADTARKVRALLLRWVETIAERHTGRKPPSLNSVTTKDLARWLRANIDPIARLDLAHKNRHPLYDDINRLVGTTERGGQLVAAINRHERHFAGPCPTTRAYNQHGEPIECGTILYADIDETTTQCPTCRQHINVEQNRLKAAVDRDLLPEPKLLEVLENLGEKISRVKLYDWIRTGRLKARGWIHNGNIVSSRVRRGDPAVYSLRRARKLRTRETQSRQEAKAQ